MTLKIDAKTFHLLSINQDNTLLPLGQITSWGRTKSTSERNPEFGLTQNSQSRLAVNTR